MFYLTVATTTTCPTNTLPRKHLAGSPTEFNTRALPKSEDTALEHSSALFSVRLFSIGYTKMCLEHTFPVDSSEEFAFSVFLPANLSVHFRLYNPLGETVDLSSYIRDTLPFGDNSIVLPVNTYLFLTPILGVYNLTGTCTEEHHRRWYTNPYPTSLSVLLWNKSETKLYSSTTTYSTRKGIRIGIVATVYNKTLDSEWKTQERTPLFISRLSTGQVMKVEMNIIEPDDLQYIEPIHNRDITDEASMDGIYTKLVEARKSGTYQVGVLIHGRDTNGVEYVRSSQHVIRVVIPIITLLDNTTGIARDSNVLEIRIAVNYTELLCKQSYIAYTEVWGTHRNGSTVPVCWIGGIVDVVEEKKGYITLILDERWLRRANAVPPLILRNIRVQQESIVISTLRESRILLSTDYDQSRLLERIGIATITPEELVEEMYWGKRPTQPIRSISKSGLILVHGYCTNSNPFENMSSIFGTNSSGIGTRSIYMTSKSQCMDNDVFAQAIVKLASQYNLTSFGLIAHSQGGLAALHLLNYYWTGLDLSIGERRIQSIGSPYHGNTLAGYIASIGHKLGIGCGLCYDLTREGANMWLKGITKQATEEVYFYTTRYDEIEHPRYCSRVINFIISTPNDGVAELEYTGLVDAHNMGTSIGECHSKGMAWPSQCEDLERDTEMNRMAAR